jgi:hypothetical protein
MVKNPTKRANARHLCAHLDLIEKYKPSTQSQESTSEQSVVVANRILSKEGADKVKVEAPPKMKVKAPPKINVKASKMKVKAPPPGVYYHPNLQPKPENSSASSDGGQEMGNAKGRNAKLEPGNAVPVAV